ncbi:MAG TPA: YggS family pyridoxal phosphate-dependent enzyme [Burkholderiaceae bacterium]|nr:YggS family pyridoxal phosphate-dependent enzyme [Burkholderiaceae bacterium]
MTTIEHNLQSQHLRIREACQRFGRDPASVQLLAVSKTFGPDAVAQAVAAGQRCFGENYVQEGVDKILSLRASHPDVALAWHCIGPLQANKTRPVAEHFDWVHTIDRLKIAQRLSDQRPAHLPPLQVCLQVNVDGGANKSGVAPDEVAALAQAVAQLPRLTLRGLMCIPEPTSDFEAAKSIFESARDVFDAANASGLSLDVLSMGMSDDLEAAVAAGSTIVRVGRGVFGSRPLKA